MGLLAEYVDANAHLDKTKIEFVDDVDAEPEAEAAFDVIVGRLASLFPDNVLLWDVQPSGNEELVPALVRRIAAMLMAAYRYSAKYSEEDLPPNDYADRLEKRALKMLDDLAEGRITIWDKTYGDIGGEFGFERGDFWPDDTYTPEYVEAQKELDPELQPARFASMDLEL